MDMKAVQDQVHSHCANAYLISSGMSPILLLKTDDPLSKNCNDFFEVMGLKKRMKVRFGFECDIHFSAMYMLFFPKPLVSIFNTVRFISFWFLVHVSYKTPNVAFHGVCTFVLIFDIYR